MGVARERITHSLIFALYVIVGIVVWMIVMMLRGPQPHILKEEQAQLVRQHVRWAAGNPESPYTLIEFADYACPGCRKVAPQVASLRESCPDKIRFTVFHAPLPIHPQADETAVIFEAVREQAEDPFQIHQALLRTTGIHPNNLLSYIAKQSPSQKINKAQLRSNLSQARVAVEGDIRLARQLGIKAIPTFLLCRSDGSVLQFPAGILPQARDFR
jgi:protein-disulfide isomerase